MISQSSSRFLYRLVTLIRTLYRMIFGRKKYGLFRTEFAKPYRFLYFLAIGSLQNSKFWNFWANLPYSKRLIFSSLKLCKVDPCDRIPKSFNCHVHLSHGFISKKLGTHLQFSAFHSK